MNCLDEHKVQMYIDNELHADEHLEVEDHLNKCKACLELVENGIKLSIEIKDTFNNMIDENIIVPDFHYPKPIKKTKRKKYFWLSSAAAAILVLFILSPKDQVNSPIQHNNCQNLDFEIDANKPISEMVMIMKLTDPDGNISEIYLE